MILVQCCTSWLAVMIGPRSGANQREVEVEVGVGFQETGKKGNRLQAWGVA